MKLNRVLILSLILILSVFVISCGDDSNNNGFYEVTSNEIQENNCSGEFTPVENDFLFFKIKEESFFGMSVDTLYECSSNDESSCETEYGTWLTESSWSSGFDTCNVGETIYKISSNSNSITITETTKTAELTLKDGEKCDTDLVEKYNSKLQCESIKITKGDRL